MRKLQKFTFPVLIGVFLLILAACGGDGDSGGGSTAGDQSSGSTASSTTSSATTGQSFIFQYVCVNRTLDTCKLIQEFIDAVDTRTNGQVEIQISSYPELGISGFDMIRLIEDGTVGFGEIYSGFVGGEFPIFNVGNLWGLFTSADNYFQGVDAISDDMVRIIDDKTNGGVTVGFNFYPSNFFFTKAPLNSLDDFKGLRTRSHSNVLSDLVSELGADPQTMAFAEVYTALERGILDGGVTCAGCGFGQKWHEVTKYLTGPIPGSFAQTFLTFNRDDWQSLPADFQKILLEEGAAHTARNRAAAFVWDKTGVEDLTSGGMTYAEFTPEMTEILASAGEKAVLPAWVGRAGGYDSEAVQLFNEKISSVVGLKVNPDNTVSKIAN